MFGLIFHRQKNYQLLRCQGTETGFSGFGFSTGGGLMAAIGVSLTQLGYNYLPASH